MDLYKRCCLDAVADYVNPEQYEEWLEMRVRELEFENKTLKNMLYNATGLDAEKQAVYECWAGSEGIAETTAPEAYLAHLIKQMRDIASKFLGEE